MNTGLPAAELTAELTRRPSPWKTKYSQELVMLWQAHEFNHQLLPQPMGCISPAETEENCSN